MSITDELRKEARGFGRYVYTAPQADCLTAIADRIDAEHQKAEDEWKAKDGRSWLSGYGECRTELLEGNEAIAADLEEAGWVRGPLDADGKMWRSGDMSDSNWGVIEGIAYEDGRWLVSGHDTSAPWIPADSIRHHHEPTVEDVLREFADEMNQNLGMYTGEVIDADDWRDADAKTVEKFAAKLRLAGDGE